MALTLLEASKIAFNEGRVKDAAIIKQYADSSAILDRLPFRDIAGSALSYNREETMPGIGFRGVNEAYSESTGVVNPQTETLAIAGGDLDVDKFLLQTMGADTRDAQEMMKVRALSLSWTNTFINGDTTTAPKEFDGLKKRLTGTQLVDAGATSGGDALSLEKLDELIDQVGDPGGLILNKTMRRRLTQASRSTSIGGFITTEQDDFGRQIEMYSGIPLLVIDEDNERNKILPFTEDNPGGGSPASTSIYCVSMGEMRLMGIQNQGIMVTDLGEQDAKPVFRTRVEWYSGFAIFDGRAAARLQGITDAAVTA